MSGKERENASSRTNSSIDISENFVPNNETRIRQNGKIGAEQCKTKRLAVWQS